MRPCRMIQRFFKLALPTSKNTRRSPRNRSEGDVRPPFQPEGVLQ